ncbi:MAG: exodeoxyribonuclease VII small subunit [Planctomycetota bacterium]
MASAKKRADTTGYTAAAKELETILDEIEDGTADIDVLGEKVERAAELIRQCQQSLTGTEIRVKKVVEELTADDESQDASEDSDDS